MKKFALVCLLSMCAASPVLAGGKQDFTLINKTGYPIQEVYVSPNQTSDWEEDVLGQSILNNNQYVNISFSRSSSACKWDLKVVYSDGDTSEWANFDLCKTSKITVFYNRKTGETSAQYQ